MKSKLVLFPEQFYLKFTRNVDSINKKKDLEQLKNFIRDVFQLGDNKEPPDPPRVIAL